jgi:hypothetical protein
MDTYNYIVVDRTGKRFPVLATSVYHAKQRALNEKGAKRPFKKVFTT